jgi:hypothetical protein
VHTFATSLLAFAGASVAILLTACSSFSSPTTYWPVRNVDAACSVEKGFNEGCGKGTPEIWKSGGEQEHFRVHYVEFDDQGWLHPLTVESDTLEARPRGTTHIDLAMRDLASSLEKGRKVRLIIFVHGWKHRAEPSDRDVVRFRELLDQFNATRDTIMKGEDNTDIIGIYVGWRGRSWETSNKISNLLLNLTFWTRKAAAIRVAQGEVRELFARVRGLQEHYNADTTNKCKATADPPDCLRTMVIGHSFGGWITYAALAQSLVEVLSNDRDVPEASRSADTAAPIKRTRARVADLILLVNPAFEAVRYASVHQAALRLKPLEHYEPPLLITITSRADGATGKAFPAGRYFNSLFEQKANDTQREAILNTPGHMPYFLSHKLERLQDLTPEEVKRMSDVRCSESWKELGMEESEDNWGRRYKLKPEFEHADRRKAQLLVNAQAERAARKAYFATTASQDGAPRPFCGGLVLMRTPNADGQNFSKIMPIWNITTSEHVIPNHSDFMTPPFFNFMKQIYSDHLQR